MDNEEFTLGYLTGRVEHLIGKVDRIEKKLDSLEHWKIKVMAMATTMSALVAIIWKYLTR